ncbi:MAG: FAD-dependent oxidoreductase [Acidimicrobiales bacterium]
MAGVEAGCATDESVTVVGAGVVGLSCAVRLAEAGYDVEVVAREAPLATTSAVAAAIWYPYRAYPFDRVLAWSRVTYGELCRLADDEPDAGVRVRLGVELLRDDRPDPWWASAVPAVETVGVERVPAGFRGGWRFASPVVDMSRYLPWLERRLGAAGGHLSLRAVDDLSSLGPLVVNCSGLGARELVDDPTVEPVRGQVVVVEQVGLDEWILDEWIIDDTDPAHPTYVTPRIDDVVLGGTDDAGAWDLEPDPEVAASILARARALVPELGGARVLEHKVGLRPARPAVRLEDERHDEQTVVHCYGHGGSGVTLSWGCADEVLGLVRKP